MYDLGYKKKVFMSPWQRSLHNVDRLKAQPWWTERETKVEDKLKVRHHIHSLVWQQYLK